MFIGSKRCLAFTTEHLHCFDVRIVSKIFQARVRKTLSGRMPPSPQAMILLRDV